MRVHRTQNVIDRSVLASRVHPLQADEQGALPIGVEQLLERSQLLLVLLDLFSRVLVVIVVALKAGIDFLELYLAAGGDPEAVEISHHNARLDTLFWRSEQVDAVRIFAQWCFRSPLNLRERFV